MENETLSLKERSAEGHLRFNYFRIGLYRTISKRHFVINIRVVEKFHSLINKTASIDRFHKIETDGELVFQQFYLST